MCLNEHKFIRTFKLLLEGIVHFSGIPKIWFRSCGHLTGLLCSNPLLFPLILLCQYLLMYIFSYTGIYYRKSKHDGIESAIVNADGIYLATYSALLLNLKLINQGYYNDENCDIPMTEVVMYKLWVSITLQSVVCHQLPWISFIVQDQFVSEVEESGVLVYLSSRWLCELYQQVLSTDLLTITNCASNVALTNLLSGTYFHVHEQF